MIKNRIVLNWRRKRTADSGGLPEVLIVTLLLTSTPLLAQGQNQPSDRDRMQGEWRIALVHYDGKAVFGAGAPAGTSLTGTPWSWIEVAGKEIRPGGLKPGNGVPSIKFATDSTQNPRQIDIKVGDGTIYRGIYEYRGNSPIVCVGLTRPNAMRTQPGDQHMLIMLERIPAIPAEPMKLDKSWWKVSSVDSAGEHVESTNVPADKGFLATDVLSWLFDLRYQVRLGGIWQDATRGGEVVGCDVAKATSCPFVSFGLGGGNPPGRFDACWLPAIDGGGENSLYVRGLYEIDGDKLRLRFSPVFEAHSPEARPADLSMPRGAKGVLVTLQRITGQEEAELAAAWRQAQARQRLDVVKKKLSKHKLADIHDDLVEFVGRFAGTQAADEARKLLQQSTRALESQRPEIAAPRALDLAEQLLRLGKREAAFRRLEAIIRDYPGTEWAGTAQRRLVEER